MGNSQNKTLIVWMDPNINSNENRTTQNEIKRHKGIELESFNSVEKGINILKKEKFKNTIIITSGSFYPSFYNEFQKIIKEIIIIPKIIIYTREKWKFISDNENILPIKHPFYNSGGVVESLEDVKRFIESSISQNEPGFEGNNDELFKIQYIKEKNDLILPLYYHDYLRVCKEEEIKEFNKTILSENQTNTAIEFIFSQLAASGKIPINLLTKFWLRAYSVHSSFSKKMNGDLAEESKFEEYSPFILKLYESVEKDIFPVETSTLYKGIIVQESEWKQFFTGFKPKDRDDDIPKAVLYNASFFSFYKNKSTVEKSRENRKGEILRFNIFICLILEGKSNQRLIRNQIKIDKEISYYESDDEVLFFPFSCFEIKNFVKKGDKDYVITLNYLHNYSDKFSIEERRTFVNVTENDYSKMVFDSSLINPGLIQMPHWLKNDTKIFQNNKTISIVKPINDNQFLETIKRHCFNIISQNDNKNDYDNLRKILQNYLKEEILGSNWWICISNERINNYGNVRQDSVMIFQYNNSYRQFYIHVAKLSN